MISNRLHNLDYLRGLAAFSIMIYHYALFSYGDFTSDSLLKKIGIYGVAIFYVLSGLTLFHVYNNNMLPNGNDLKSFFLKRLFRIFPLLWLVTIITIFIKGYPGFWTTFLNLSGLFSVFEWYNYIGLGVWSIGNELVFYLFFPVFIFFLRKSKSLLYLISLSLLIVYLYFAFFKMPTFSTLIDGWKVYINPLNQVFLFLSGFLVGYFFQYKKINSSYLIFILTTSLLLFIFYPIKGDAINLVSGLPRLIYSALCILICLSIYKIEFTPVPFVNIIFSKLGEISYSLYLLHPIIWRLMKVLFQKFEQDLIYIPTSIKLIICTIISVII